MGRDIRLRCHKLLRREIMWAIQDLRKSLKAERDAAEAARAQAKKFEAKLMQCQNVAIEAAAHALAQVRP